MESPRKRKRRSLREKWRRRAAKRAANAAGAALTSPALIGYSPARVAIYYRVSTDRQDLASQRSEVERYLASLPEYKRPRTIAVFKDEGISGAIDNRPGLDAMLHAAWTGQIDTIVVFRLDRLSRKANHAVQLVLALEEAGVAFVSTSQPVLNLGPENPFRRTMLAAFSEIAEIEREMIVGRVNDGLAAARRQGKVLGPPRKVDAAILAKSLSMRAQGKTYRQIAKNVGLSVGTVYRLISGPALPPSAAVASEGVVIHWRPKPVWRIFSKAEHATMVERAEALRGEGLDHKIIGLELGVRVITVQRILRRRRAA